MFTNVQKNHSRRRRVSPVVPKQNERSEDMSVNNKLLHRMTVY